MISLTSAPFNPRFSARLLTLPFAATLFILLSAAGCAIHKVPFQTYRLVWTDSSQVLVPPGVAKPALPKRTFDASVAAGAGKCPSALGAIGIERSNSRIRLTVTREMLLNRPAGWLNAWTAELETQGCIASGAGPKLAGQIAEALPLDTNQAFHLLYSNQLDITPQMRIQVVSPIRREATATNGPQLRSVETSGNGNSVTVNVKSAANLIGYEMASYAVQAKPGGTGLVPLYADRHIGGETERRPKPEVNYFRFPSDAGFYRVFYEAEQTEYTALVIAARTRAELEQRTKILGTATASCQKLNNELCVAVPAQVAINGLVAVIVNGSQTFVNWGTTIGGVVRAAGERQGNVVLPRLAVYKLHDGKPAAVEFDHASRAILDLIVTGGEVISW